MKRFAMMVLGCKVNDYEATYLRRKMLDRYEEVPFKEKADIYIIFTCCVTNIAEAKTRKMIHRARHNNEDAYIVAIGCLSQIKGDTPDFEDVDLIVGSQRKDEVFDLINERFYGNVTKDLTDPSFESLYLDSYPGKTRAFLKIQDGCNQYCSYCVIPYARGKERSGRHEDLIKQAKILSESSKELVLTGIHTGRYDDGEYKLYDLLKELEKIEGLKTIRLSSIEINEVSDEIIDLIKGSNKIANHLHIPVQSCSDEILSLMHRPYTIQEYKDRISYIRKEIPDISISTDLIVGFPGETDELFEKTISNLKEIAFSFIHVFPYARKKGTFADGLDGHLSNDIKKERVKRVIDLEKEINYEFKKKFIGKELEMLIEKTDEDFVYGYVKQYFYVQAQGKGEIGDIVRVRIEDVREEKVSGSVIV